MIASFICIKVYTFAIGYIMYLIISDIIMTLSGLIVAVPVINSNNICIICAFLIEYDYGRVLTVLWNKVFAKLMYMM